MLRDAACSLQTPLDAVWTEQVGPVQLLGAGRGVADPGIASVGNWDKRAKAQPVSARGRTKSPRDARSQRSGPRSAKAHVVEQMRRGN